MLSVIYYSKWGYAHIEGPGGFTQVKMTETEANAIAYAIGAIFERK